MPFSTDLTLFILLVGAILHLVQFCTFFSPENFVAQFRTFLLSKLAPFLSNVAPFYTNISCQIQHLFLPNVARFMSNPNSHLLL